MADNDPRASDETVRREESPSSQVSYGKNATGAATDRDLAMDETASLAAKPNAANAELGSKRVSQGAQPKGSRSSDSRSQASISGLEEAKTVIRQADSGGRQESRTAGRTPAEIAKVLVGEQLNQYHLEALVGGGGMGAVFRAHDQRLDRVVALKVIPFVGNDPELQRRFRNEAQNAAKLDHPRIARIFDAGDYNDWHYIVFEYIDGTNIRDLVENHGVLSLDDAVMFTSQVAEALDHAAQRGIVHRDIKPSNVLVSEEGVVKLVDMGLARSDNLDLSEDMTASGVTLGTFDYISPEQAFDPRDADLRSDLYSLGCTFYFMVTGEAPYTGGTMLQKLISHGNAPPPNPQTLRADLPDEAVAVMHRMMAKDPQARYQNAGDLLADLNELAYRFQLKRAQSHAVVAPPTSNDGLQRLQVHLPWMFAALLIAMVAGYLELQSAPTRDAFQESIALERPKLVNPTGSSAAGGGDMETEGVNAGEASGNPLESSSSQLGGDADAVVSRTTNEMSVGSRSEGDVGPSGATETGESGLDDLPDSESTIGASASAADAARPPSFDALLPVPDEMLPDTTGGGAALEMNGEQPGGEETGVGSDMLDGGESNGGEGAVLKDGESTTSESSDVELQPNYRLPSPTSVRVVSSAVLPQAIRVNEIDRDTDGAILTSTLSDAIELAMRFGVLRIEFTTREIVTGPVAVPLDNMVFESVVGRTRIRMVSQNNLTIGRSEMWNLGNHRTQFVNLDFQWELRQEQVDGGSMFVINDNRLTKFEDCSFTLINRAIHDGVSVFSVVTDPEKLPDSQTLPGRIFNPDENALPLVALQFDDVIVRGEATFIRMDYAVQLQLVWNNGLLAISGRMIDTEGARERPSLLASPIHLSLANVIAEVPLGVLRMRLGVDGEYPVPIRRDASQCIFLVDEGQPHFQMTGVDQINADFPYLKMNGNENAYIGSPTLTDPLLQVTDRQGNSTVDYLEELASQRLSWIDESRPRWSVSWTSARPRSQLFHRLTPGNYRQDGAIYFGFDESDLPEVTRD